MKWVVVVSLVVFWLELVSLVELVILLSVIVSGAVQHFLPHQHLTFLSHKFPPGSDSHSVRWVIPWMLDLLTRWFHLEAFTISIWSRSLPFKRWSQIFEKKQIQKLEGKFSFWTEVRFNLLSNQFAGVELIWICRFDKQGIGFYKYLTKYQFRDQGQKA